MDSKTFTEIFEAMGFFEITEEDDTPLYCYEPEEDGRYLIATDELGHTPKEDENIIVACYSPEDAFLWKIEMSDVKRLYEIFQKNSSGFIAGLELLAK